LRLNDRSFNLYQTSSSESRLTLEKGCPGDSSTMQCLRSSPCQNQGECVEGFGTRTHCNCASTSFTGDKCEQPASTLSFNGSHSLEYVLPELRTQSADELSLRFRTRLRNGALFSLKKTSEDTPGLVVSLEDGRVKVNYDRADLKNDKVIYLGEENQFNNNKWHSLTLRRNGQHVHIQVVDNQRNKFELNDDLGDSFNQVSYRLVNAASVRASNPALVQEHPNFIGWLQNIRFNGEELRSDKTPKWAKSMNGKADSGENSLLLHHAITFTQSCRFALPQTSTDRFNIHLFIKTSQQNGIVLHRRGRGSQFLVLEVAQGRLRFAFNLGGGAKELTLNDVQVNDNNWHEVTVRRVDQQKFALKCDDFKELLIDMGTQQPLFNELESFNVGGSPDSAKNGFVGCLAALEINNETPSDFYSLVSSTCASSIQRGCMDLSCQPDTCSNNGVCSVSSGKVQCNCEMTSFTGPSCKDNSNYYFFGKDRRGCGLVKYAIQAGGRNLDRDRLAFGFTTTNQNAVLTRVEGDSGRQYIEVRLREGLVQCVVNLNNFEEIVLYSTEKRLNDNLYHVVQVSRERAELSIRVDNFDLYKHTLKTSPNDCVFRNEQYVLVGAISETVIDLGDECYYGVISGMFFNGQSVLDRGNRLGDVGVVDHK
jgi:neurexin